MLPPLRSYSHGFCGSSSPRSRCITIEPTQASITISGGRSDAARHLRAARRRLCSARDCRGYAPLEAPLTVGEDRNQTFKFALTPLPGRIDFDSAPVTADVSVDGAPIGTTPLKAVDVAAGVHKISFKNPRYVTQVIPVTVEGKQIEQNFGATLSPNWANITVGSIPSGAAIFVDDQEVGVTPSAVEVLAGSHELRVKHAGFRHGITASTSRVGTRRCRTLAEAADGLINVASAPAGIGYGQWHLSRETPIEIALMPGKSYQVRVTRAGYESPNAKCKYARTKNSRCVSTSRRWWASPVSHRTGRRQVSIDAKPIGRGSQTLTLPARLQGLEVTKSGFAPYTTKFTPQPGLTQEINVKLLTVAEARLASLKPRRTTAAGQEMILFSPGTFSMGTSRREPGRRANEVLRDVTLTRMFYLSTTETTNAQFKQFASGHDSGLYEDQKLNGDEQPTVKVSWAEAALYCNWLSERDHLPLFYKTELGKVVGIDPRATGYRLPTEAEWEWVARTVPDSTAENASHGAMNFAT